MQPLATPVLALIASLRCQALPWSTIAERVGLEETQLRLQLATQRAEFQTQMDLAKADLAEDLLFAELAKLQQLLQCGKQSIENDAAKSLLRFHQNLTRPTTANRKTPAPSPTPSPTPTPNRQPEATPSPVPTKPTPPKNEPLNFQPLPQLRPPLFPAPRPTATPLPKSG